MVVMKPLWYGGDQRRIFTIMMNRWYDGSSNDNECEVMVTGIIEIFPVFLIFFYIFF